MTETVVHRGEKRAAYKEHLARNKEAYRNWFGSQIIEFGGKGFSDENLQVLLDCFDYAYKAHRKTSPREEGVPYISHPVEATLLLIRCGIKDVNILQAELLHDTIEDSDYVVRRSVAYKRKMELARAKLAKKFNPEVADIVIALTKPEQKDVYGKTERERKDQITDEGFKKLTAADNKHLVAKILITKLGDRLQNLLTLEGIENIERRKRTLKETEDILMKMVIDENVVYYFPQVKTVFNLMDALLVVGSESVGVKRNSRKWFANGL